MLAFHSLEERILLLLNPLQPLLEIPENYEASFDFVGSSHQVDVTTFELSLD